MNYTLITGATGCLGRAFAFECARRGENIYLTGRSGDKLAALRGELVSAGAVGDILIFPCDLADEKSRGRFFEDAGKYTFSRLLNVAGADIQKAFSLYDQQKLTFQIRSNFEGAVAMCAFCIAHRGEELRIINISSLCGEYAIPYFAIYSAAKGALTSFSLALSAECAKTGVSVTAVLPGAIHTRPDVVQYIKSQGIWGRIATKTPQYVAVKALSASDRGKKKTVPGLANKLVYFSSKLLPSSIRTAIAGRQRRHMQKDAF